MDEEVSLVQAREQSHALQQFLQDLDSVWLDAASREIHARFLDVHQQEDECMLRAFETQSELLYSMQEWLNAADTHMQRSRLAHQAEEAHCEYAQHEIAIAEHERNISTTNVKEAIALLPRILRLVQAARTAGS